MQLLRVTVEISDDRCHDDGEPESFNPWTVSWNQEAEMENVDEKEAAFLVRIMAQSLTGAHDKVHQLVEKMRAGKAALEHVVEKPGEN
ncbi:hypothetical protein LCGC14_1559930 [marine sediment metagenome]|uniref:Uncharacterized protein n=1 Tax=marine sediment metagenome TaxID=412755 RepID=A0A0F9IMT4_9ZZZZ